MICSPHSPGCPMGFAGELIMMLIRPPRLAKTIARRREAGEYMRMLRIAN